MLAIWIKHFQQIPISSPTYWQIAGTCYMPIEYELIWEIFNKSGIIYEPIMFEHVFVFEVDRG